MDIDTYNKLQTKLTTVFEQAMNSKDTRGFFTYLYNYADIIIGNPTYNKEVVGNALGLYYGDGDPDFMKDIPNFGAALKSPSEEFNKIAVEWLTSSLINEKYQTEVYHCELRIMLYYLIRKSPYEQRGQYKSWLQHKVANTLIKNEFTNIFKLNTDKGNHTFKTPIYRLSLELFHPVLLEYFDYMRDELSPDSATPKSSLLPEPSQSEDTKYDRIALGIKGRVLWLIVNKQYYQKIKRFDSKANYNFKACRELLRHRNAYLTKEGMGIGGKSPLKDLPKTMGFKGILVDYFVDLDTENDKLRFLDNVEILHEELPNLITFVKNNFKE